jgi:hypothetical protein
MTSKKIQGASDHHVQPFSIVSRNFEKKRGALFIGNHSPAWVLLRNSCWGWHCPSFQQKTRAIKKHHLNQVSQLRKEKSHVLPHMRYRPKTKAVMLLDTHAKGRALGRHREGEGNLKLECG